MSRKPIIAGNWKLNKNLKEVKEFIANIDGKLPSEDKVEVAMCSSCTLPCINGTRTWK